MGMTMCIFVLLATLARQFCRLTREGNQAMERSIVACKLHGLYHLPLARAGRGKAIRGLLTCTENLTIRSLRKDLAFVYVNYYINALT